MEIKKLGIVNNDDRFQKFIEDQIPKNQIEVIKGGIVYYMIEEGIEI